MANKQALLASSIKMFSILMLASILKTIETNSMSSKTFCAISRFCSATVPDEEVILRKDNFLYCALECLNRPRCTGFNWLSDGSRLCSTFNSWNKIILVSGQSFCHYYDICEIDALSIEILVSFNITVKTGSVSGAGTDADVTFTLNFPKNFSQSMTVVGKDNLDAFENSRRDVFNFEFHCKSTTPLKLESLKLEHNNTGVYPDWFVSYVELINLNTGDRWYFNCLKWLKDPVLSITLY